MGVILNIQFSNGRDFSPTIWKLAILCSFLMVVKIARVGIWLRNICIADFFKSGIKMPGTYYLPGKKIVDKLSAIQITIRITDQ